MFGTVILLLSFLWLSMDGHYYWHEIRFLYGTTYFDMGNILAGKFNPHQLGGGIDEQASSGFYSSKVLHLGVLKALFTIFPPANGGLWLASFVSFIISIATVGAGIQILRKVSNDKPAPIFSGICLSMMPIIPYLSGKLLSEVSALFWLTLSILLFLVAAKRDSSYGFSACLSAGCLVFCGLSRIDMVLGFIGFYVAYLTYPQAVPRAMLIKLGIVVATVFATGYLAVLSMWTPGPAVVFRYFTQFVLLETKSIAMSVLGIGTFGGLIYLAIVTSVLSKDTHPVRFFGLWLSLTIIPMILITLNYMVEPRYLASAILPAAGLGAIGLSEIWRRCGFRNYSVQTVLLIVSLTLVNKGLILLMPYELDAKAITRAANDILSKDRDAAILVPWSYTDFHFLKVMMPEARLFNVDGLAHNSPSWRARMVEWYGQSYIDDENTVVMLLKDAPVYYLGWRKYPPAQNIIDFAEARGLRRLASLVDSIPLRDHLADNWLWKSPGFSFEKSGSIGQYQYFRVSSD